MKRNIIILFSLIIAANSLLIANVRSKFEAAQDSCTCKKLSLNVGDTIKNIVVTANGDTIRNAKFKVNQIKQLDGDKCPQTADCDTSKCTWRVLIVPLSGGPGEEMKLRAKCIKNKSTSGGDKEENKKMFKTYKSGESIFLNPSAKLFLFDISGNQVRVSSSNKDGNESINTVGLPQGIYILRSDANDTTKILIE